MQIGDQLIVVQDDTRLHDDIVTGVQTCALPICQKARVCIPADIYTQGDDSKRERVMTGLHTSPLPFAPKTRVCIPADTKTQGCGSQIERVNTCRHIKPKRSEARRSVKECSARW